MPRLQPPDEDEIRTLVGRIVDAVVERRTPPDETPSAESGEPSVDAPETIAVGADHGGFRLKERIAFRLKEWGHDVIDCGTDSLESVDYPDFARAVAEKVASGECRWGIVIDGAGIGSCMAANKVPGVRAASCRDISAARNSREHNHANVLTLGAGLVGEGLALQIVEEWLATPWGGGRHARRVDKIQDIEHDYMRSEA